MVKYRLGTLGSTLIQIILASADKAQREKMTPDRFRIAPDVLAEHHSWHSNTGSGNCCQPNDHCVVQVRLVPGDVMRWIIIVAVGSSLIGVAHGQPDKVLYELQERCDKRAAEVFQKERGGEHVVKNMNGITKVDYEDHYSPRLNKCFFLVKSISSLENGWMTSLELFDLNEHKQYGSFSSDLECEFQGKVCRSEQEWWELAKPFLDVK